MKEKKIKEKFINKTEMYHFKRKKNEINNRRCISDTSKHYLYVYGRYTISYTIQLIKRK